MKDQMMAVGVLQNAATKLEDADYKETQDVIRAIANGVGIIQDALGYYSGGVTASFNLGRKWYRIVVSSNARISVYLQPDYRPDNPQYNAEDRKIAMEL